MPPNRPSNRPRKRLFRCDEIWNSWEERRCKTIPTIFLFGGFSYSPTNGEIPINCVRKMTEYVLSLCQVASVVEMIFRGERHDKLELYVWTIFSFLIWIYFDKSNYSISLAMMLCKFNSLWILHSGLISSTKTVFRHRFFSTFWLFCCYWFERIWKDFSWHTKFSSFFIISIFI